MVRTAWVVSLLISISTCACDGDPTVEHHDLGDPGDLGGKPDGAHSQLPKGVLILDNVTVVDAEGATAARAVLIHGEVIYDIRAAKQAWPPEAEVVDGTGRYVVPGLVDPHVHLTYAGSTTWVGDPLEASLRATLYHGVTAVMDVGASESIYVLRDAIEKREVIGPTLRATGPFLTAPGSHPCEISPFNDCVFVEPANAKVEAQGLVARGADALKVALADTSATPWPAPRLAPAAIPPMAGLSVPLVVHVNSSQDVLDAVAGGAKILAHPVFAESITPPAIQAASQVDGVHTTLGAFSSAPDLVDGVLDLDDPNLIVADGVQADWRSVRDNPGSLLPGWVSASRKWTGNAKASLAAMRQAGVKLVPGSDAGYLFVPHGLGLQLELRRLAALGWSPLELLRAATKEARELIGLKGGTIAKGEVADLLVLSQNPTKSVEALASIEQVILRGQVYQREALLLLDLQVQPSAAGGPCLGPAGCKPDLACDRVAHLCRPACKTPYAPINACGAGAWCMPLDSLATTQEGVCRPEKPCDLYHAASCGPAFYSLSCFPLDADTNGCLLAGPDGEGQACSYTGPGTSCKPGLYCSPIDARCYRLCDPQAATDSCPAPTSCTQQEAGPGVPWFGLCL